MTNVKVGQVWADNDRRSAGRHILVTEVVSGAMYVNPWAMARACDKDGVTRPGARVSRIRLARFKPNSTGYRLVKDVEDRA